MTTMLEAALAYAKRGWPIFPCRANKAPYTTNGFLDATTDPATIKEWWERWPGANVAVSPGDAGMLVLDYDPGSSDEEAAKALGGSLPKTKMTARTPRGGRHDYYLLPPRCEPVASTTSTFAAHVDVRSFHGYVLLPPSRTADGAYEWVSDEAPGAAPQVLLDACRAAREKDPLRDEWLIEPDLPEHVDKAVEWLRNKARLAIEGSGGDSTTYATAAMMKSFGLSEASAVEVLWEHWNPRCAPPWEYEDLQTKVTNAYSYNTSPPGNMTPAYHAARIAIEFKPRVEVLVGGGHQTQSGRFRFVDRAGLEAIPAPSWLIPDFLPEGGYGLLIGRRGSLKTFFALDAALTVASGGRFPWDEEEWRGVWAPPDKPGKVLYTAGEGRPGLRQRVRAWETLHRSKEWTNNLVLGDPVPRVADGADPLKQFIDGARDRSPDGYRLVVLDTVGRSMQGVNENSQEFASAFTALVEHLQRELGSAVLAIHHSGHESAERGRGSSVFEADCDTIVVTSRQGDSLRAKLTMTKQKDAQEWSKPRWAEAKVVQLGLDECSLAMTACDAPPEAVQEEQAEARRHLTMALVDERAMDVLAAHPLRSMTNTDFAKKIAAWRPEGGETLGVTDQAVRKTWLPRLRAEECQSREFYDPSTDKWRYQPPAGK